MKLEIPKPITEVDISHVEEDVATHVREAFIRNPDYTNSGYGNDNTLGNMEFRRAILEDCKVEGLVPGAVVVHKKIVKDRRTEIFTWGIIYTMNAPIAIMTAWRPVKVKWLSGSFEDCHATDLIIMNYIPDKALLKERANLDINPNPLV